MGPLIDVLIPTYRRPTALAVTLASLAAQSFKPMRVVVSDQTEDEQPLQRQEVQAVLRALEAQGRQTATFKHLPRRGMAEHRQFLLEQAQAPYVLYLDDDLLLENDVVERMHRAVEEERCGFVGCGVIGLSYANDVRPHEQAVEFWDGPVQPEVVRWGSPAWERHRLHNAANLWHVQRRLGLCGRQQRKYRVAWVGACVLYDRAKLLRVGGFSFWKQLPREHCGEDVVAQQRVMAAYGGCGILPSGVYHLELPTTIEDRRINAPLALAGATVGHGDRKAAFVDS